VLRLRLTLMFLNNYAAPVNYQIGYFSDILVNKFNVTQHVLYFSSLTLNILTYYTRVGKPHVRLKVIKFERRNVTLENTTHFTKNKFKTYLIYVKFTSNDHQWYGKWSQIFFILKYTVTVTINECRNTYYYVGV